MMVKMPGLHLNAVYRYASRRSRQSQTDGQSPLLDESRNGPLAPLQ